MKAYIWQSYHRRFSPLEAITSLYQYLSAEDNKTYLPNIVTSTLKSIVAESDHRQNRMIFKLAVELAERMGRKRVAIESELQSPVPLDIIMVRYY